MTSRLPLAPTQRIDPDRELPFYYRGRPLKGLEGDTVATALFSKGVRIFSRSLKYHRPRGLYNLDGYSSHCLMSVDGEPNVRACMRPLRPGMVVEAQNVMGSPEWDLMSVLQWLHFAMPAGFYYKMFHRPAWLWPLAQKVLRYVAGVGKLDPRMPDSRYDNQYLNAEVCIIGGGPAGMRAALATAKRGVRVILLERRDRLGGALTYRVVPVHNKVPAFVHAERLADEVLAQKNIRVLPLTTATSVYQSNHVTALQEGGPADAFRLRYLEIRAKSVVVATGAIERPIVFENNDCPGVMQGSCAQQLVHTYGLKPGDAAVLSGCHDGLLEVAVDLAKAGVQVVAAADARTKGFDAHAVDRLDRAGISFYPGYVVTKAKQSRTLRGAVLRSLKGGEEIDFPCDLLVATAGEVPLSQLLHVAGASMAYDATTSQFLPKERPPGVHAAGRVLALDNTEAIEAQGEVAGLKALKDVGLDVGKNLKAAHEALASLPGPGKGWNAVDTSGKGWKRFVSFDEDVTVTQIEEAMEEGFDQPELTKRYTATGTGPSQSYLSGYNLPVLLAEKKGLDPGAVMPTTVRPPVVPTSLAVLGGRRHKPVKRTPFHAQQKALGASFRLMGAWKRARHFGPDAKAWDEVANVRTNVGFIDISTLGKFRIHGADALKLLQRVYVRDMNRVAEGGLTYAAMCNEEGVVIDDGVVTRRGENDFWLTTSTARAAYTPEWLNFHSKEEDWEAYVVNMTDALAAINLVGPRARHVLRKLTHEDVSNEALPYMGFRRMILCGHIDALIARVGFVGELCYEIHVPASQGPALHAAVTESGTPFGIKPFGTEAQTVLRLEKGHLVIVVDTDNHTTLHEIGLAKIWDRYKRDAKAVGAPALRFAENQTHRQRLVGFMMEDPGQTPRDGSIVVAEGTVKGRVCTSRFSPTLSQSIGMALVDPDLAVMDGMLEIYVDGKLVKQQLPKTKTMKARIVPMPFYDPKGERVRV